jgi:regulator of protease activity HflC (stomatin/prohibitin superfamily)
LTNSSAKVYTDSGISLAESYKTHIIGIYHSMDILEMINGVLNSANNLLDFVFFWGGWLLVLEYPIAFLVKGIIKINKEKGKNPTPGKIGDLFSQTLIWIFVTFVAGIVWSLPEIFLILRFAWGENIHPILIILGFIQDFNVPSGLVSLWTTSLWGSTIFRWVELSLFLFYLAYLFGHKNGERRWLYSAVGHIAMLFIGLLIFNRWMGLIFISLPVLVAYYFSLYNLAVVLLPASNPEDRAEQRKRYFILVTYAWGVQFPMFVVDGHAWKKLEPRIPGDIAGDFPVPGLVWTRSHQVAAITGGTKFKRIDGPGVVFTGSLERPFQIFDLRLQVRTNEIEVVSKDGVSFKVRVFTAFRLDPEPWDKETYEKLRRMNPLLRGADKPSYTLGSFPFSHPRIQATLGVTSTKAAVEGTLIYWDQWVLNVVEDMARKVISQKNLDELWRPDKDEKFANALDVIANEIRTNAMLTLRGAGILVLASRVVNFSFPGEQGQIDEISKQQIATWGFEWERKRAQILSEAQAESERTQQEARAYAESLLLNSIAEGLQKAYDIDAKLPRYVIAMRFLSSLQDYVHKQTDEKSMEELQNSFKEWQEQFFTDHGKEKKR